LTDQVTIQETEELTCEHLEEVAAGLGAGKVSMQDFHFAASSATGGAGAGKVSMQDFHFV
jgi:hypothetical protein